MNKVFVTDFDRTLYVDFSISEENKAAISKWREDGNIFIVATGRDTISISEKLENAGIQVDYLICNNGAVIMNQNKEVIFLETIDNSLVKEIATYILDNLSGAVAISCVSSKFGILNTDKADDQISTPVKINLDDILNLSDIVQVHKRIENDMINTQKLCEEINSMFSNKVTAFANQHNTDIVKKGVDKAHAIEYILKSHPNHESVTVIGDSFNDINMIKMFNGHTMEFADEKIKASAKNIYRSVHECILDYI